MDTKMYSYSHVMIFCLALYSIFSTASAILEGSNVCTRTETYVQQIVVSEQEPCKVTETEWCIRSFSLRCLTSRYKIKTVQKIQNVIRQRLVEDCCEGFTMNASEDGCVPECSMGCIYGTCVAPNQCLCETGYGGPSCDISCPFGFWGSVCQHSCQCENNSTCDPFNGECRCSSGWMGEHCEKKCAQGTYGQDCSEECQCGNGNCDHVSGECSCKSGWMGPLCDTPCPVGRHGSECKSECNCQNGGTCDPESGQCFCEPGWTGAVCANRCPSGFWGRNCSLACDCNNGATCHHINGECECKPGFIGDKCSESCPEGTFGLNCTASCDCAYGASCSSTTGKCLCPLGWHGDECKDRSCPEGLWGPKCKSTCDCDENNSVMCHPWTGVCECKPGWISKDCSESLLVLSESFLESASSRGTFYGVLVGAMSAIILLLVALAYMCYKPKFRGRFLSGKSAIKNLQYATNPDGYHTGENPIYQPIYSYEGEGKKNKENLFNNSKITNNLFGYKHANNDLKSGEPSIDVDKDFPGKRKDNLYTPSPFKATVPSVEEMRLLKNHEVDAANLNIDPGSEKEHIYEEIKDQAVEYDKVDQVRHEASQRYQQVKVSVMSPSWEFKSN